MGSNDPSESKVFIHQFGKVSPVRLIISDEQGGGVSEDPPTNLHDEHTDRHEGRFLCLTLCTVHLV